MGEFGNTSLAWCRRVRERWRNIPSVPQIPQTPINTRSTSSKVLDSQSGVLTSMEQQKVNEGSTTTTNKDAQVKDKGNKTDYSSNSTTTTSDNIETYQMYTIESDKVVYVASEHLLFPWSKPANVNVGENIKYVVEKGKIIILDERQQRAQSYDREDIDEAERFTVG